MVPLNLPYYPFKLKEQQQKTYIFDEIRKKYLLLTPEEWVRQHIIQYLITYKFYPRGLISIESSLILNTMTRRSDILIVDRTGCPLLLVECKAPHIKISQATLDQAARYNTAYSAPLLVVTNGLDVITCQMDHEKKSVEILAEIPPYSN